MNPRKVMTNWSIDDDEGPDIEQIIFWELGKGTPPIYGTR